MFRSRALTIGLIGTAGILLLLSAASLVCLGPLRNMQKINAARADIQLLEEAVKGYREDVGEYPPCLDALIHIPGIVDAWRGPYLNKTMPLDPWGQVYQYATPGTHNLDSFDIWTVSPEGMEIGNWPSGTHSQNTM
jgi:general secretion pathway protein G